MTFAQDGFPLGCGGWIQAVYVTSYLDQLTQAKAAEILNNGFHHAHGKIVSAVLPQVKGGNSPFLRTEVGAEEGT